MAACGAKILHRRCVEYARRFDMPIHVRSVSSGRAPGSSTRTPPNERRNHRGSPDHRRRRARPQRGQDHRRRRARPSRQGGRDLPGLRRRRDQHRHDRPERLRRGTRATDISFTCPKTDAQTGVQALKRIQGHVGFMSLQFDDHIGKLSLIGAGDALAPRA